MDYSKSTMNKELNCSIIEMFSKKADNNEYVVSKRSNKIYIKKEQIRISLI